MLVSQRVGQAGTALVASGLATGRLAQLQRLPRVQLQLLDGLLVATGMALARRPRALRNLFKSFHTVTLRIQLGAHNSKILAGYGFLFWTRIRDREFILFSIRKNYLATKVNQSAT